MNGSYDPYQDFSPLYEPTSVSWWLFSPLFPYSLIPLFPGSPVPRFPRSPLPLSVILVAYESYSAAEHESELVCRYALLGKNVVAERSRLLPRPVQSPPSAQLQRE